MRGPIEVGFVRRGSILHELWVEVGTRQWNHGFT